MKFTTFAVAATATMITPLKDYPKYESAEGPNGQIFGKAAPIEGVTNVPMLSIQNYPLEITNRVEASFMHESNVRTENIVGAKMIMETVYPTYNLNNNAHVSIVN
jgi:hypothetical protein